MKSWWIILFKKKSQFVSTQISIAIVCSQLNGFKYYYVTLTIQRQSFICTQLNGQTVLFDPQMRPCQVLSLQVSVDLRVTTIPKVQELKHQKEGISLV